MIAHARADVRDAAAAEDERDWLSEVFLERWGGDLIVGRRLIEAAAEAARAQGARELVVMTANDNLRALRLYQRTGFRLYELRAGGVQVAGALIRRKAGPQITGTR